LNLSYCTVALLGLVGAQPSTQVLSAGVIVQAVHDELAERLGPTSKAQIEMVGRVSDAVVPVGNLSIKLGSIAGRWPRSRVGIPVQLLVDLRSVQSLTVWAKIQDERSVLTYSASYPAHALANRVQLLPQMVDMTCCAGQAISRPDAIQEKRLKSAVTAGRPAMVHDFELLPAVVAREPIDIEVQRGSVRLHTHGVALSDGQVGDQVRVKVDQASAAVSSRVIDNKRVVVDE
jgi:flagella basal body P-ring formation protein FlgA